MSLSHKQRLELTIFGYIRLNYKDNIIDAIKRICFDYYDTIEVRWDIFCDTKAEFVSDDGLEVTGSDYGNFKTYASSTGWNQGIHSYTLKITPADGALSVGIISSEYIKNTAPIDMGENYFLFCKNKDVVGYCIDNLCDLHEIKNGQNRKEPNQCIKWKARSSAVVVVDCDNWKLKFYVDDEMMFGPIDIAKDKIYHPIFCEWASKRSYKLVETTIDICQW